MSCLLPVLRYPPTNSQNRKRGDSNGPATTVKVGFKRAAAANLPRTAGENNQSKIEEDVAGAAESTSRSSSTAVAKQRALEEMHARLGGKIEDILVKRIQPKEKVAEDEWRCKAPMHWKKGLLRALTKLVRLDVTIQEIKDLLCARVDARQREEGRTGPGNAAVRQTEVYEVMDLLKAMGRGMNSVSGDASVQGRESISPKTNSLGATISILMPLIPAQCFCICPESGTLL